MIDYETYSRIHRLSKSEKLNALQIAQRLGIDARTVGTWLARESYQPFAAASRTSKLDPFKGNIARWLEACPSLSARQIYQRLQDLGFQGGQTIVKDCVRALRPPKRPAYLTLAFAPGECAQVDWGSYGSVPVGATARRLSFFVMVLCHSRQMYIEFTLMERMEHFLQCHVNAFKYFGGVPEKVMIDNLKSAVLEHPYGGKPAYHPRYMELARHYGFEPVACKVRSPNEKGIVESAVGYVKKNFLNGLQPSDYKIVGPAGQRWLDEVANLRIHATTRKRPHDLWLEEKPSLSALPVHPYDAGVVGPVKAGKTFRVSLDGNRYSVPPAYASRILTLKRYPERLCVYHGQDLVATHLRSYERDRDFENPEHVKSLLEQRKKARWQTLYQRYLALCEQSQAFGQGLESKRLNPRDHIRKIMAQVEIYGKEKVVRALRDAVELQAYSSEYIANILEQRDRHATASVPGALHLTRSEDLLELELPEPDLSLYDDSPSGQPQPPSEPQTRNDADAQEEGDE